MGMFRMREPRKFRRVSIYTDERRDKLEKLVNEVKREQGDLPPEHIDYTVDKFKGKFGKFTPRTQTYVEHGRGMVKWPVALVVIILLFMLWRYLLTGDIHF